MPLVRCKGCGAQASVHPEELAVAGDYCPDCQPFEEATCDRCADPICPDEGRMMDDEITDERLNRLNSVTVPDADGIEWPPYLTLVDWRGLLARLERAEHGRQEAVSMWSAERKAKEDQLAENESEENIRELILERLPYAYNDGEEPQNEANAEECVEYAAKEIARSRKRIAELEAAAAKREQQLAEMRRVLIEEPWSTEMP